IAMKKLYTLLLIMTFMPFVSIGQFGMNISGSHVIVHADTHLGIGGDLEVSYTEGLIIKPEATVTTTQDLTLDGARRAIVVETSTASGSPRGSYIVYGDVNVDPSNKGSMEVQSYITGLTNGSDTLYYMHFVGAPVEDTTTGYNNSVRLQQFNMTYLDTYAYEYDASIDTNDPATPWVNVWPFWHEVPLGKGLALTNGVAGSDIMYMEGYPIGNTNITYNITYNVGNPYELLSNPFPSAIDFDQFASDNATRIFSKYRMWSASGGNYLARTNGTGASQYIQYGQAFFVVTRNNNGNVTFNNNEKVHSTVPFRETNPNELSMYVEGGSIGFKDELFIRFIDNASHNLDEYDMLKWNSINASATMIRSIAEDGSELSINMLPEDNLYNRETTVPVFFDCGENAEYTFTFEGIESFNGETEIWLEDLQTEERLISVSNDGFQYSFTAIPEDERHRFNIYFFGPTSIFEDPINNNTETVKIYGYGNYAYVLNNSDEALKKISIHNLMGQTIYNGKLPQQTLNKIFVSGQSGYYVVSVETTKNMFTEKVFILK
ncbi:MAG: hypothetical protein V2I62_10625, partial [Bacteroidales bacterium]|nr:hypothetical protein [Bacteroidales bacterium]